MKSRWSPGEPILSRQVLHGAVWAVFPEYVVADDGHTLVSFVPTGAEFGFPVLRGWVHPWAAAGRTHWTGHGKLSITRAGDPFSSWIFWSGPGREFTGWYINLQEPLRRHEHGYDTLDQELDLVVDLAGVVHEKDVELFEERVREGRYPEPEATVIRNNFKQIRDVLRREGVPADARWCAWEPPAEWGPLALPTGWDAIPATVP